MKKNYLRNFTLGLLIATGAGLNAHALPAAPYSETAVTYTCGDLKPDATRNLVYVVDQTDNEILEFDTNLGSLVNAVPILDGSTTGLLAVSVDGTKLYLAESSEDKILVFSLPDLTPKATLSVNFSPGSIVVGAGGRLYASKTAGITSGVIVELNTTTGAILQTFGSTENYYNPPLLRAGALGKNLYACVQGLGGFLSMEQYDVTGATASAATGYQFDCEFLNDYQPDEANNRILTTCGGTYGIGVINTTNGDTSTVWNFSQPYGESVSFSSAASVVYGSSGVVSGGDIMCFNRADGTPLTDNIITGTSVKSAGLAATANGKVLYIRQSPYVSGPTYIGIIGSSSFNPSGDPLGGTSVGSGYFYNPNLGYYNETNYPWVYHVNLGWMYCAVPSATSQDVYLYSLSPQFGWLYTNPTSSGLPYFYSFTESSFLYYEVGTTNFYNMTTGQAEYHLPPP